MRKKGKGKEKGKRKSWVFDEIRVHKKLALIGREKERRNIEYQHIYMWVCTLKILYIINHLGMARKMEIKDTNK